MNTNSFNICPTCVHRETCVLTTQKSKVWSCSEYDELTIDMVSHPQQNSKLNKKLQPELVMA